MIARGLHFLSAYVLSFVALAVAAWAQPIGDQAAAQRAASALNDIRSEARVPVFGAQLFERPPISTRMSSDPNYEMQRGDRIAVRAFGAYSADLMEVIDQNGVLFIPEVGPVELAGRRAGQLQPLIENAVRRTFTENVRVYATIVSPGSVGVYVTGDVNNPGRHLGGASDDVLYFLQAAGGINEARGSFRDIRVMRSGQLLARVDLYAFLLEGSLPRLEFQNGDTIVVTGRGPLIEASGDVIAPFAFELPVVGFEGGRLGALARPLPPVTHVALTGTRNGKPFADYLTLAEFRTTQLRDGDRAEFRSDTYGDTIAVAVQATSDLAPALHILPRDATLTELLAITPVDADQSDLSSVHVNRRSVASAQKRALDDALDRLQRSVSLSTGTSRNSAAVQQAQAEAVTRFVTNARKAEPTGTVTVMENGELQDLTLEDGDVVVIPDRTDVVLVVGEVISPGAFVESERMSIQDYVRRAGGFQQHANKSRFVVRKRTGAAFKVRGNYRPEAGDQILVLPRTGNRAWLLATDITEVIFQLALSTATVARL
ncbi:MAG: polysaccharide biosynthesis/export family protein [Pseudomonadota bacterium]